MNNPEDPSMGTRKVPFTRELYIEQDDFREEPPKGFFRLSPGREVRLRYAYIVKCIGVVKDSQTGEIKEIHCTYDPETKSGLSQSDRKVKATIHWVSAASCGSTPKFVCTIISSPKKIRTMFRMVLIGWPISTRNPWNELTGCRCRARSSNAKPGERYQFERLGYFCVDNVDSSPGHLVFNRTVTLRDTWAKIEKSGRRR